MADSIDLRAPCAVALGKHRHSSIIPMCIASRNRIRADDFVSEISARHVDDSVVDLRILKRGTI